MVTLEDYLDAFNGCLIVVSHDRYFLDRTVEHIFRFEAGGHVREYPGNYTAFLEARHKQEQAAALSDAPESSARPAGKERAAVVAASAVPATEVKRKLTFKEQRELGELEARIQEAEERQTEIEGRLAANSSDAHLVHELFVERETLSAQLARDLERWAELAELA
jgi:ATP-binding cassette subfamily F protein uup